MDRDPKAPLLNPSSMAVTDGWAISSPTRSAKVVPRSIWWFQKVTAGFVEDHAPETVG